MSLIIDPFKSGPPPLVALWDATDRLQITTAANAYNSDGAATNTASGSWGAAGAFSIDSRPRSGGIDLAWTAHNIGGAVAFYVGLARSHSGFSHTQVEYGFRSGTDIWELGTGHGAIGGANGDLFEIRISTAGAVTYIRNGSQFGTGATTAPAGDYHIIIGWFSAGVTITGLRFL